MSGDGLDAPQPIDRLVARGDGPHDALATVAWVAGFDFPDLELDHELLALRDPAGYAIDAGEPVSSSGLRFPLDRFPEHVVETQVPHSTALHASLDGRRYLTGPLARYTLNSAQLSPLAHEAAASAGLGDGCRNPFRSVVVRAVETVYALDEALRWAERTPAGFTFNIKAFSMLTGHPTKTSALYKDLRPETDKANVYPGDLTPQAYEDVWTRFLSALDPLVEAGGPLPA